MRSLNYRHSRKQYIANIAGLLVLLTLLSACQIFRQDREDRHVTPLATPMVSASPLLSALPENEGSTILIGQLISASQQGPLSNTVVRLARVFWDERKKEGVYVLEGARSPSCITDKDGFFIFSDLEPADYVMIIGDVYGKYIVVSNSDGSAKVFAVEEGKITNIGQLYVTFP